MTIEASLENKINPAHAEAQFKKLGRKLRVMNREGQGLDPKLVTKLRALDSYLAENRPGWRPMSSWNQPRGKERVNR